jgi:hypothetical protein
MSGPIDLNQLVRERGAITVGPPETPEDAKHRRRKDFAVLVVVLLLLLGGIVMGFYFFCNGSDGQQKWAQAALTTILGAVIAYGIKR